MKIAKRFGHLAVVAASLVASSAFAAGELTTEVTTQANAAKGDIATAGAAIIAVVVAIAVVGWIRRVIK